MDLEGNACCPDTLSRASVTQLCAEADPGVLAEECGDPQCSISACLLVNVSEIPLCELYHIVASLDTLCSCQKLQLQMLLFGSYF